MAQTTTHDQNEVTLVQYSPDNWNILCQTSRIPSNILSLQTGVTVLHQRWSDQDETSLYLKYLLQLLQVYLKFQRGTLVFCQGV